MSLRSAPVPTCDVTPTVGSTPLSAASTVRKTVAAGDIAHGGSARVPRFAIALDPVRTLPPQPDVVPTG